MAISSSPDTFTLKETIAREGGETIAFARFMLQPGVRIIRTVPGVALVVLGFFVIGGIVVGMIGFVPLVGGYFDGRKNLEGGTPETRRGAPQH